MMGPERRQREFGIKPERDRRGGAERDGSAAPAGRRCCGGATRRALRTRRRGIRAPGEQAAAKGPLAPSSQPDHVAPRDPDVQSVYPPRPPAIPVRPRRVADRDRVAVRQAIEAPAPARDTLERHGARTAAASTDRARDQAPDRRASGGVHGRGGAPATRPTCPAATARACSSRTGRAGSGCWSASTIAGSTWAASPRRSTARGSRSGRPSCCRRSSAWVRARSRRSP